MPRPLVSAALALLTALLLLGCAEQTVPLVVLHSSRTPQFMPVLPPGEIRRFPLEGFRNPGVRADTVLVCGHSEPPTYIGQTPEALAAATASFRPSLVVLDTCYGASTPILGALAAKLDAWVVAAPFLVQAQGMAYPPAIFSEPDPVKRANLVQTKPPYPLLRWRLNARVVDQVEAQVARWGSADLRKHLQAAIPPLVRVPLPSDPQQVLLVRVAEARFRP